MPFRHAASPYWYVSYTDRRGRRRRRSTGTADRAEAEALEHAWKLEVYQRATWGRAPERTFDELLLAYLPVHGRERDHYSAKALLPHFSGRTLQTLEAGDFSAYEDARRRDGIKDGTIAKELGMFRAALRHANRKWDWQLPDVLAGRVPAEGPGRVRWATREELARLLAAAERQRRAPYLHPYLRLAVHTGMRSGELLGLEWSRVDWDQNLIYLDPPHQKSRRQGSVPLNAQALAALRALRPMGGAGRWVFRDGRGRRIASIKKAWRAMTAAAGVEGLTPHCLRHTAAAWMVQAGVPLRTVAEVLRHRDIRTTMRYAHLSPQDAREAVARLEGTVVEVDFGWDQSGTHPRG